MTDMNTTADQSSEKEMPGESTPGLHGHKGLGISRSLEMLRTLPAPVKIGLVLAAWLFVAVVDTVTGPNLCISIFYLIPIIFAGGFISRHTGLFVAAASVMAWGYLEVSQGQPYEVFWIFYWNIAARLVSFLLINELVSALVYAYSRERTLSRTDGLTGIANARVFEEHAERTLSLSRRNGLPFTIAYIDLDHFKQINDEFGHAEGDRLLRTVALHIGVCLRKTDTLSRLGGDEFGILLPDTGEEQAGVLLGRIKDSLASKEEGRRSVSTTIGAVTFSDPPDNVDYAVFLADALMYKGKAEGRGCILQSRWPEYP